MPQQKERTKSEVGYCRPPVETRFQPGKSGNPRGRPKGHRNLATDVRRTLAIPVKLSEQGGKSKHVSTQEAALMRLREKALNGDARALDRLLDLAARYAPIADSAPGSSAPLAAEDQAILDAYLGAAQARGKSLSEPQVEESKKKDASSHE